MKRKIYTYHLVAVYFIYVENCVTTFKISYNGSLTKVLQKARQKAKTLKCDNWYIESMRHIGIKERKEK